MNLLTDDLLRVETTHGRRRLSLPGLLAALGRDEIVAYAGLQRHQEEPWHVFLCYLAAAALERSDTSSPAQDEAWWRESLRRVAGRHDDLAWTLVVPDLGEPAFLQPPVLPFEDRERLKTWSTTPDGLDVLVTSKNHDVKAARAGNAEADCWAYALVTIQTTGGYAGAGHYGIARMNGGYGTRVFAEVRRTRSPGLRWRDAVTRLLDARPTLLSGPWNYSANGTVLLWLPPWDGRGQLRLDELDPFFIEICRRLRLVGEGRIRCALAAPARCQRIAGDDLKGVLGDPWIPIDQIKQAALTPGPAGLTADLLRRIIFEDGIRRGAMQRPLPSWEDGLELSVAALVRGQGTTEGYREAAVPIPRGARIRLFASEEERHALAELAKAGIEVAGAMERRVLKPAWFTLAGGAPDELRFDREPLKTWWHQARAHFDTKWEPEYFPWLWATAEEPDEDAALRRWIGTCAEAARDVLGEAAASLPRHAGRRYRSRAAALSVFEGALRNVFPQLKEDRDEHVAHA